MRAKPRAPLVINNNWIIMFLCWQLSFVTPVTSLVVVLPEGDKKLSDEGSDVDLSDYDTLCDLRSNYLFPSSARHRHSANRVSVCNQSAQDLMLEGIEEGMSQFITLRPKFSGVSSFSNPFVNSPTSQLILQPFRRFTYVKAHSPTLLSFLLRHRIFTYVTWRAAHGFHSNIYFKKWVKYSVLF